jgi:hypothetical protein
MNASRLKFAEAKFFLDKVDNAYYEDVHAMFKPSASPPKFFFYLSAFLSAARSIAWITRSEYGCVPGWEEWYNRQKSEDTADLLSLFNKLRIRSEKVAPVIPGRAVRIAGDGGPALERDPRLPKFHMTLTPADPDSDGMPIMSGEVIEWKWTIDELDGDDLVEACRRYLNLLSELLADCENKFPKAAT